MLRESRDGDVDGAADDPGAARRRLDQLDRPSARVLERGAVEGECSTAARSQALDAGRAERRRRGSPRSSARSSIRPDRRSSPARTRSASATC